MTSSVPFWRFATTPINRRARAISSHINRYYSTDTRLGAEVGQNATQWYQRPLDRFPNRHIGPSEEETSQMLRQLEPSVTDLEDFIKQTIPASIRSPTQLSLYHNVSLSESRFG